LVKPLNETRYDDALHIVVSVQQLNFGLSLSFIQRKARSARRRTQRKPLAYFFDATDAGDARKVRIKRRNGQNARIKAASSLVLRSLRSLTSLRCVAFVACVALDGN